MIPHPGVHVIRRREGIEPALVVHGIAEGNQAFMTGTVVPAQGFHRHAKGHAVIKHAFQIGDIRFLLGLPGFKEVRGRHLLRISHHNHLAAPANGSHGFRCRKLGGFVKDNDIEAVQAGIQILRYRNRTHQHAGSHFVDKMRNPVKDLSYGNPTAAALLGLLEKGDFLLNGSIGTVLKLVLFSGKLLDEMLSGELPEGGGIFIKACDAILEDLRMEFGERLILAELPLNKRLREESPGIALPGGSGNPALQKRPDELGKP